MTDPLSAQGLNRYAYVQNNPMNFVDPTGFMGQEGQAEYGGGGGGGPGAGEMQGSPLTWNELTPIAAFPDVPAPQSSASAPEPHAEYQAKGDAQTPAYAGGIVAADRATGGAQTDHQISQQGAVEAGQASARSEAGFRAGPMVGRPGTQSGSGPEAQRGPGFSPLNGPPVPSDTSGYVAQRETHSFMDPRPCPPETCSVRIWIPPFLSVGAPFAGLSWAPVFGIHAYKVLQPVTRVFGLEAHHLVPRRFAGLFGQEVGDMLSIAVTKAEHQAFTNAWKLAVPYNGTSGAAVTTQTASREFVMDQARKIYANYPAILRALGLAAGVGAVAPGWGLLHPAPEG